MLSAQPTTYYWRGFFWLSFLFSLPTAAADCDLNGDWVMVTFTSFDVQTFSLVNVVQSGRLLSVSCQDGSCGWSAAQGSVDGKAMMIMTDSDKEISGVLHAKCDSITTGIPERLPSNWLRVNRAITRVHAVFMTHLDVGYTLDTSMAVLEQYRSQWFPKAYATAEALPGRFRWTTHPWLMLEILNNATGTVTEDDLK